MTERKHLPKLYSSDLVSRLPYPPDPWTCEHGISCEDGSYCPEGCWDDEDES